MALKSRDISRAIYYQATNDGTLPGLLGTTTSVFDSFCPDEDADMPYVVFTLVSVNSDSPLSQQALPYETVRVQFSIFDDSPGSTTVYSVMDALEGAFDVNATALTFADSTYEHIHSERDGFTVTRDEKGIWQIVADYLLRIHKL